MLQTSALVSDISKRILSELTMNHRHELHSVFDDAIDVMAISISNNLAVFSENRESQYMSYVEKYGKDWLLSVASILADLTLYFEENYEDILGRVFHELELHNKYKGQFFTPYDVSRMMAKVTLDEGQIKAHIKSKGFITVSEPASGSGGMLIAVAQEVNSLGFNPSVNTVMNAVDIDRRAVRMCYLQLSLCNIPAVVIQGNTLSMKFDEYWYTPAYVLFPNRGVLDDQPINRQRPPLQAA